MHSPLSWRNAPAGRVAGALFFAAIVVGLGITPTPLRAQGFELGEPGPATDGKLLETLSSDPREDLRVEAARLLGERKPAGSLEALVRSLQSDPSTAVRRAVIVALGSYDEEGAREALHMAAETDPDAQVRELAATYATRVGEETLPSRRRLPAWRERAVTRWGFVDPDAGHVLYGPTAYGVDKGDFAGKGFAFGHWQLRYGLTENWEVGGQVTLPVFVLNVGGHARYHGPLADHVYGGVDLGFDIVKGFDVAEDLLVIRYGGGPVVSFGSTALNFTISLPIHGLYWGEDGRNFNAWLFMPHAGFSARVHEYVKLLVEFHVPVAGDKDGLWGGDDLDIVFFLLYGIRLHGERFYGDIGFVIPFWDDEFVTLSFMPIGYPMLSFGFTL